MKQVEISVHAAGLWGVMTLTLVGLKLLGITEVAEWSWWLVLVPLWGPLALFFGVVAFLFLAAGLLAIFEAFTEAK